MVSAIITAAGRNKRMRDDLKSRGMEIRHKLLLSFHGNPIILQTLQNTLKADVDECIVVLGHFSDEIISVLDEFDDERVKIVVNSEIDVELSESLLNGVKKAKDDFCLCVAADQPAVSAETFKNIVDGVFNSQEPENTVSILARGKSGYLNTAEGLGMPFACRADILKKYLTGNKDNLNPLLRKMVKEGVVLYGVPPRDDIELLNINEYDDYIDIIEKSISD
ncbi:nucleotidyltransferase family protein [Methanobacterium sp.]|uniref:nucleotidyltransferase family protein n=1 Tax=Methanobacterium sp. TaxID=2164 RepID=UPI003C75C496